MMSVLASFSHQCLLMIFHWSLSDSKSSQISRILLSIRDYLINAYIYPTPPLGQYMTQGHFFKRSLTGLNSEFSFSWTSCLTKAEEPSLPYYLPIAGRRIIGFIPFPKILVVCEMQSVASMI